MNLLTAAALGVLQGLTEFLPVSSTAHLLIAARLVAFEDPGGVFTVTIQFGSILAIVWLYRRKVAVTLWGARTDPDARRFVLAVLAAFVPLAGVGFFFGDFVRTVLYDSPRVIASAFIVGGIVMWLVERFRPAPTVFQADKAPIGSAVLVGLCQTLALIPGVSRSGATIVGGMLARFDRPAAAEFSFFLAMPTMAAAFASDMWAIRGHITSERALEIAVGFVMAFVAAALVVRPFLRFVTRVGFGPFAWYRLFVGAALYAALSAGWMF